MNRYAFKRAMTLFLFAPLSLIAVEIHVAPTGNDLNPGTVSAPLKSLAAARDAVRPYAGKEAVMVYMADGTYYLPQTLVFAPEDSGSARNPVIYQAENEGHAILSGGSKLSLQWTSYRDGIFQAKTPKGLEIDQLFINGMSQCMARYPNYDVSQPTAAYQGFAADAFSKERAEGWADPTGGYIHAMHRSRWGGYHYRITGKDSNGEVTYEGGWQNNRRSGMHADFRMVENIFEELDAAGEWFHNAKTGMLYYMPEATTDLNQAVVEVVRLSHLIEFQGSVEAPVRFITLQGFVVRHAARTFMDTKEPMLRSDWAIYRGGAVMLTGTEDVSILDCEFDQVGGNAAFVNEYNRRTLVKGCHIHDAGASGVCFVGDPNAVRNPLFEYGQKNDLAKIDRTVGPKTENYPALGTVEDCLIHGIGRVERQPAGVQIEMAMKITVRDTSVYDCARAGINIGDGCWGGHLIERCDVFDTVLETHDHGSFNSWGRDRYWRSDRGTSQKFIDVEPNLPFLDAMHTTTIRSSRWRCDHGWDIDLDDGSSNYEIYSNLLLNGGLKFREGFRRRAWNNIMVNNSFHPHVWYINSGDEFYQNIVMTDVKGIRAPTRTATGKTIDKNLYFVNDPKQKDKYAEQGWDLNSIIGDPLFIDPAKGDFRVKEGSPAFKIGFKNFPMDQFGVKKPSLKAIAETPDIPALGAVKEERVRRSVAAPAMYWLGTKVHGLVGEEFSAYGVRKEDGGVALMEVPGKSAAARAGFKVNDLLQAVNGHKVSNTKQLFTVLAKIGSAPLRITLVRHQRILELSVEAVPFIQVESKSSASGFSKLTLPSESSGEVTANQKPKNDPLASLVDGALAKTYGPIFANGVQTGAYKMDLGQAKDVHSITTWSFHYGDRRGPMVFSLFGSDSDTNPGWNLNNPSFTPLGSIDTTGLKTEAFAAVSLQAAEGHSLGKFRWIVWSVSPISRDGENTVFQELAVETRE
ncbi:right-handed parallel beta-helix repeat-containing protein [Planctomycetota bacterium]